MINQVIVDIYILWKHKDNNSYYFINEIKATMPKDVKGRGEMDFWFGFYGYDYITIKSPEHIENLKPEFVNLNDVST